jgi:hypothetical protein
MIPFCVRGDQRQRVRASGGVGVDPQEGMPVPGGRRLEPDPEAQVVARLEAGDPRRQVRDDESGRCGVPLKGRQTLAPVFRAKWIASSAHSPIFQASRFYLQLAARNIRRDVDWHF